jgi:hypothetical protein
MKPKIQEQKSAARVCSAIGKILPKNSALLRVHAGEAELGKLKYHLATAVTGTPVIRSQQTGKWFVISWQEILELAVKAGIDATEAE